MISGKTVVSKYKNNFIHSFINSKNDLIQSVIVFNSLGQEIQEINNIQQENYLLNTEDFPTGTYYISIECQSLRTTNSTIVKL